jgi:hypothetical protein
MVCSRYSDALIEMAAGGLGSPELKGHLEGCQGCRKALVMLEQLLAIADEEVGRLAAQDPSPGFMRRLHAAVGEPPRSLSVRFAWFQPSLVTVAVLVFGLAVVLNWYPFQAPSIAEYIPLPKSATSELPGERVVGEAVATNTTHEPETLSVESPNPGVTHAASAEIPVLVPAGETRALMDVIALANAERLIPDGLSASGDPSPNLAALIPISITPIEIVPLESDVSLGT